MTKVNEIMSRDPECLFGTSTVVEAAERMRDCDIGNVLVMNGEELLGVITDRDIAVRVVAEGTDPATTSLKDFCTSDLVTVGPDEDAHAAAQLMREKAVRRLPVVENGRPVGIVSIGDLAMELDQESALASISEAPADQ